MPKSSKKEEEQAAKSYIETNNGSLIYQRNRQKLEEEKIDQYKEQLNYLRNNNTQLLMNQFQMLELIKEKDNKIDTCMETLKEKDLEIAALKQKLQELEVKNNLDDTNLLLQNSQEEETRNMAFDCIHMLKFEIDEVGEVAVGYSGAEACCNFLILSNLKRSLFKYWLTGLSGSNSDLILLRKLILYTNLPSKKGQGNECVLSISNVNEKILDLNFCTELIQEYDNYIEEIEKKDEFFANLKSFLNGNLTKKNQNSYCPEFLNYMEKQFFKFSRDLSEIYYSIVTKMMSGDDPLNRSNSLNFIQTLSNQYPNSFNYLIVNFSLNEKFINIKQKFEDKKE